MEIGNSGGVIRVRLESSIGNFNHDYDFQNKTWYCIEQRFFHNVTNGGFQVWVDGVLQIDEMTYDTSGLNQFDQLYFGRVSADYTVTLYGDCVVIDDAYIGVEGGEPPSNVAPVNESCLITNIESGNITYAMETWYTFQAIVNDTDGLSAISNVTIAFTDNVTWLNFTWVTGDTWNRTCGYTIGELNSSACSSSVVANVATLNFSVRIKYGVDEISDVDIYMLSFDGEGLSDGYEIITGDYFGITKRDVDPTGGDTSSLASRGFVLSGYLIVFFVLMVGGSLIVVHKR